MNLTELLCFFFDELAKRGVLLRSIRVTPASIIKDTLQAEAQSEILDISCRWSQREMFHWRGDGKLVMFEDYPWRMEYIEGQLLSREQFGLWRPFFREVMERYPYPVGAEVGVFEGFLAQYVLKYVNPKRYFLVDPFRPYDDGVGGLTMPQKFWDKVAAEVKRRFQDFSNVTILHGTSQEAATFILDNSLDFVYIDGDHSEQAVFNDIITWLPKIKEDGLLGGHDYSEEPVRKGIEKFRQNYGFKLEAIFNDWWLVKE